MQEEQSQKLLDLLGGLDERAVWTQEWLASEAGSFVREVIAYHLVVTGFWFVFYFGLSLVLMALIWRGWSRNLDLISKIESESAGLDVRESKKLVVILSFSVVALVAMLVMVLGNLGHHGLLLVKIWLAPRLFVVDFVREWVGLLW